MARPSAEASAVTDRVIDFVLAADLKALPDEVVHEGKRAVLDAIGCAFAGATVEKGRIAALSAPSLGGGASTIIGYRETAAPAAAAFANAELIHAMDFSAITDPPAHVSPFVIPPLLALAERANTSDADLLLAVILAHELSLRLGAAVSKPIESETGQVVAGGAGFGLCVAATALAASRMLGFSRAQANAALGIAGTFAPVSHVMRFIRHRPVGMTKMAPAGWLAQAATSAVILSGNGYTGDPHLLDGEPSFGKVLGGSWDVSSAFGDLGTMWRTPGGMVYKQFPCAMPVHPIIQAVLELVAEHQINPADITRLVVRTGMNAPIFTSPEISSTTDAQFSVPHLIAVALSGRAPGPDWMLAGVIRDPDVKRIRSVIQVDFDPSRARSTAAGDRRSRWAAEVLIETAQKTVTKQKLVAYGDPSTTETRMTDEDLVKKFAANCGGDGRPAALGEVIMSLDNAQTNSHWIRGLSLTG